MRTGACVVVSTTACSVVEVVAATVGSSTSSRRATLDVTCVAAVELVTTSANEAEPARETPSDVVGGELELTLFEFMPVRTRLDGSARRSLQAVTDGCGGANRRMAHLRGSRPQASRRQSAA